MKDEEKFWTNNLKAVIYVRVSSEWQVTQWHWLESQEMICRKRCEEQPWLNIEVVKVFREEWVSWKEINRKEINEVIKYLEEENKIYTKIHYFIVTDSDRIARPEWDITGALLLENKIESTWVKIITVGNERDTETDEWKLMQNISYAVAWYERKKIRRRTMNGKLNSLKSWWRPFPKPPLWYIREKNNNSYIDNIDSIKWPIIKEWLELYAYNPSFTKWQLHKFRQDKWLQTSKSTGKLYISFIEKTFREYRLYFYAWYIYYPERWVEQPLKWNQEALISLEVVEKIFEKENEKNIKNAKWPNLDKNLELHPLKSLLTCSSCWRKISCYKTTKKKNNKEYFYYDCGNKYCEERQYIAKETMENEFISFIEKIKIPKWLFTALKVLTLKERELTKKNLTDSIPQLQWQLLAIESKMSKIEDKILNITNEQLILKLETEWGDLKESKHLIEDKIANKHSDDFDISTTLSQIEPIFTDPVAIWLDSEYEMRQLLFMVRFGWILYYKKNQWYRTNETTGLYYLFSHKWGTNVHDIPGMGLEPTHIAAPDFESSVSTNSTTLA